MLTGLHWKTYTLEKYGFNSFNGRLNEKKVLILLNLNCWDLNFICSLIFGRAAWHKEKLPTYPLWSIRSYRVLLQISLIIANRIIISADFEFGLALMDGLRLALQKGITQIQIEGNLR
ncbi:hypothetical protein L1049_017848 [Liquidambar formosana]|uniref:Uncharacterized protein n=1 Tax=Liquidambar formosana TaxID=63359 RepID=A0AAP0NJE8_LIQFO